MSDGEVADGESGNDEGFVLRLDFSDWQFDMMSETVQYVIIASLTGIIIIYSIIMFIVLKVNTEVQEDFKQQKREYNISEQVNNRLKEGERNIGEDHSDYFQRVVHQVHGALIQLFLTQSLYMLFFAMFLICFTAYWFTPTTKSALVCILAFMLGCGIGCLNTFVCLKFSMCTNMKMITETSQSNGGAVKFAFVVGSLISGFGASMLILFLSTFFFIAHKTWTDGEEVEEGLEEKTHYYHLVHSVLGFGVGIWEILSYQNLQTFSDKDLIFDKIEFLICFSSLFYRETAGQASRGIISGEELIGRLNAITEEERIIEKNIAQSVIIANTYTNNLVQFMDSMAVIGSLICCLLIISVEIPIFTSEEPDDKKYKGGFYSPMLMLTFFMVFSVGCAWIMGGSDEDSELASSIAFGTRLQMIIILPVILAFLLLMPRYIYPRKFDVGDASHPTYIITYFASAIYSGDIIWCLCLGLLLQGLLIAFAEYFTSHWFQPTRNVAMDTKVRATLGLMTANIFSSNSQFAIICNEY